jgi:hypothetical protein
MNQFRGLDACYECDYLGKEECEGGFKFFYMILELYGFKCPEIYEFQIA